MSNNDSKLFSSIKYFTTGISDSSLETTFKQNGAIRSYYLTETTTHVICDDFESNKGELEQAIEIYQTPIVRSEWISACLKCQCLLPTEPFRTAGSDPNSQLFRSCVFANANLNSTDHDKLYALVTFYGARWSSKIDSQTCTHIICASALPHQESEDETTNNHHSVHDRLHDAYEIQSEKIHLITPDWILDCLHENRLLSEVDYHPDLLKDPMDVDDEEFDDEMNEDHHPNQSTEDHPTPTKSNTTTHRSQLISKNFFNQADQTTPPPSAEPVQGMNESQTPSESMETSQSKAPATKRPRARATASTPRSRNAKNNAMMNNNSHPNQNGHPLTTKDGALSTLPIEEKLIRPSVSSNLHLSKSRPTAVENLSYELNYFTQDKHELIPSSQCLLGSVIYLDEREYSSTVSTDDRSNWLKTLTDHGAIVTDDIHHPNLTHFLCAYRTSEVFRQVAKRGNVRFVTAHWLNDVLQRKKMFVPNLAIHYPSPYEASEAEKLPLANYFFSMTGFEGLERARLRYMIRSLGGKYSGQLTKWHSHLLARENNPKSEKLKKANEWSISIVNGLWLSELFLGNTWALKQPLEDRYRRLGTPPTLDHFSFDQIFVHDFLQAWSQPIRITDEMLTSAIRRHNEQQQQQQHSSNLDVTPMKSFHYYQPQTNCSMIESNFDAPSIMISGFDRKTNEALRTTIESLGGHFSTLPHNTTHLILHQSERTEKFYQCLNSVRFILKRNWLEKCQEEKRFLPVEQSDWFNDENSSNSLQRTIEKRLERGNRPLFADWTFFLTPSLQPSLLMIQSIIHSAGGRIQRTFPTLKQLINSNGEGSRPSCLIITCDRDKILLKDLNKFNRTDLEIKLLSLDFILESIRQQEILEMDRFLVKL